MKILVIGGTGFIGKHLCPSLATEHQVVVMSRNPPVGEQVLQVSGNISYRQGDITQRDQVFAAMEGIDYVVNLSSTVIPSTSNLDPVYDVQTNLVGALNILDAAVEHKIRKLVFISSGGTVYGEGTGKPFKEDDPTNPICSYGVVKLAIEKYIQMYHQLYGLPYAILRVSNPYGLGQLGDKPLGVVSAFIDKIKNGQPIEIWGDGTVSRDFIYISDVVDAVEKSLRTELKSLTVNIGSGVPTSLNTLIRLISEVFNVVPNVNYQPPRKFDVQSTFLEISRAKQVLRWWPIVDINKGISLTV